MTLKKIQTINNLLEIAELNLSNARSIMTGLLEDFSSSKSASATTSTGFADSSAISLGSASKYSREEELAKEVVEGHFDGEYMIGDNGQTYIVPQNYASKTQLVVGDRMKWILTNTREIFKLIQPIERERVEGAFYINGDSYLVDIKKFDEPVKVLKASATFAMKTQDLEVGDTVAIMVPKSSNNPRWGALVNVIKSGVSTLKSANPIESVSASFKEAESDNGVIGDLDYL